MPTSKTKSRAHAAVVEALIAARREGALTQQELADRLPAWLGFTEVTVAKIETGRRSISLVEAREWCRVVGVTIADLDQRAEALAQAHREPGRRKK